MTPARKLYLDNIRWMTVVLVVIYHVVYMFNGVQPFGVIGPFREHQLQDCFQYLVYPWFMALLFVVSGMSARYYLQSHIAKQFVKDKPASCWFRPRLACSYSSGFLVSIT